MKTVIFSIVVIGICGVLAAGPTTRPVASATTQPAQAVVDQRVVVLPFETLGDVSDHAVDHSWVGVAVQHSLAAEVARLGDMTPVTVEPAAGPLTSTLALNTAKAIGGDIVIFGDCQFTDGGVRFTGQVVNVSSGQTMAGLKVSGNLRDLFAMEDAVGNQVRRALHPETPSMRITGGALPDQSAIFPDPAPAPDDDVIPPSSSTDLSDAYNRYYYGDVNYDFNPYGYSQGGYYGGGYGGYDPYGYGDYGSQVIIVRHGRDHDGRGGGRIEMHGSNGGSIGHGSFTGGSFGGGRSGGFISGGSFGGGAHGH